MGETKYIHIKGARQHNLKNIEVKIPRNQFVVLTGLSGSGKSSLAFDTIYAEGQRRYVESLSAYARQFLEQMDKPDVDVIEGLSPAISIEQKTASHNPRSTVGTTTEIYDYLRLLFARAGQAYCYECGDLIQAQTVSQMVDQILEFDEKDKIFVMAPIVNGRKGEFSTELAKLKKEGFLRVKIDGEMLELDQPIKLNKKKKHNIDLVVDRLVIKQGIQTRLSDSLETALNHGHGILKIENLTQKSETLFSANNACINCKISYPEIEPTLFSFNSPKGACPECNGIGSQPYFNPDLVIPNRHLSLREGAVVPWAKKKFSVHYAKLLQSLTKHYKIDWTLSFDELPKDFQQVVLFGSGDHKISWVGLDRAKSTFEGVIPYLRRRYHQSDSEWIRHEYRSYMSHRACQKCEGSRLKKESLSIKIGNQNIFEVCKLNISDCRSFFKKLKLSAKQKTIAKRILKEIDDRLEFLDDVGLNYLSLERSSASLSGGEAQRIRLATQIGSALVGVLYILDEPSIGLHQRDNESLLRTLKRLRDLGNTVLVVEHDEDTMRVCDHLIDIGPKAGAFGGAIVAQGTPKQVQATKKSLTGQYLSGKKQIEVPKKRRPIPPHKKISLQKASLNNLKNVSVDFPLGCFICVTGVSGSGKSSLINDTLYPALAQQIYRHYQTSGPHQKLEGVEQIDKVINIDQSPIGRTPRSNPATYTGVFTLIRELFSELPESKARGYKMGRYSFNVKGGRCEACQGDGLIKIEMHFLPDVYVECEVCHGKRYNRETLEIRYKGKSIADVLKMSVHEACEFFDKIPTIKNKLTTLVDVGLGYIELGQPATTLSGGEAQRIKLAKELSKRATGRTFYVLDEPTTGLHFADIAKLLEVLNHLVNVGNTVVVIEHNLDVIKCADYIIDLGPEGGHAGGQIIAKGTPEEIIKVKKSHTAKFLKKML